MDYFLTFYKFLNIMITIDLGARGVTVIVIRSGLGYSRSNHERGFWGKRIVGKNELFNLSMTTSLGEGNSELKPIVNRKRDGLF